MQGGVVAEFTLIVNILFSLRMLHPQKAVSPSSFTERVPFRHPVGYATAKESHSKSACSSFFCKQRGDLPVTLAKKAKHFIMVIISVENRKA